MMNTKTRAQRLLVTPVVNIAKVSLVAIVVSLGGLGGMSSASADWSGGIEGGTVVDNDGKNASRLRLKVGNDTRPLSHYVYADWLRSGAGNSFEAGYKPKYWFGEALYVFGEVSTRRDKPQSIDRELFGLTGVGIEFLRSDSRSLYAELGAGYRTTEFENGLEDDDTTGVARAGFQQILIDLLSLELEANTNVSDQLSRSVAEAGIAVRIPGGGALKYSYRTQRNKIGDAEAVTTSDSFVSFNYGF